MGCHMDISTLEALVSEWFKNQTPLPDGVSVTITLKHSCTPSLSVTPTGPLIKAVFEETMSVRHVWKLQNTLNRRRLDYNTMTVQEFLERYPDRKTLASSCNDGWTTRAVHKVLTNLGYNFPAEVR